MALSQALATPAPQAYRLAEARIRRCVFRRVVTVGDVRQGRRPVYEVHCLLPSLQVPVTVGDFEMATGVCNECTAEGLFRPDED